jgi:acetyl-CoA synthetase
MSDLINKAKIYKPSYRDSEKSHIQNMNEYKNLYDRSIKNPEDFWAEQA